MYAMVHICIFQACLLEERLKDYPIFSRETVSQFGTGYKSTNLKGYPTAGERLRSILLMRPQSMLVQSTFGYGLRKSQKTGNSLNKHIQGKKHVCYGEVYRRRGQDSGEASGLH
jgi:hypothetical protein